MANGGEKSNDFYAVLGLKKECTASELRNAYKKLALRWHPDRCSASGNSKFVEEAKKKFQAIQQAYSVLSDENKRFLYDVGVYDSDDDENNGMGDFLNEMAAMMTQTKPNEGGEETFEELQQLFDDMFQGDTETFGSGSSCYDDMFQGDTETFGSGSSCYESSASSSSYYSGSSSSNSKRNSSEMNNNGNTSVNNSSSFANHFQSFCVGTGGASAGCDGGEGSKRRSSRRSKR